MNFALILQIFVFQNAINECAFFFLHLHFTFVQNKMVYVAYFHILSSIIFSFSWQCWSCILCDWCCLLVRVRPVKNIRNKPWLVSMYVSTYWWWNEKQYWNACDILILANIVNHLFDHYIIRVYLNMHMQPPEYPNKVVTEPYIFSSIAIHLPTQETA